MKKKMLCVEQVHSSQSIYFLLFYNLLCQLNDYFDHLFHAFHYGIFKMSVAVVAAGTQVGAGQTHEGKAGAIGAAAAGNDVTFNV